MTTLTAITTLLLLWPTTLIWAYWESRRRLNTQAVTIHRLHTTTRHLEDQLLVQAQLLTRTRLERDSRPPPSPLTEYLALNGPQTITDLAVEFGDGTAPKLLELADRQEVRWTLGPPDPLGHQPTVVEFVPLGERLLMSQNDPTETVHPPVGVMLPPPTHRPRKVLTS